MGILETRCLDFNNLVILSVNEGILPRSSAGSSYIPFNLREAFGLPTIRHQDSIYAYYFYRLLQSTANVTFVFNSNSEGLRSGEMSRFLLQMKYLEDISTSFSGSAFEILPQLNINTALERTSLHSDILEDQYLKAGAKPLSPSAVNTWLHCRMKFYYRYVCKLKEPAVIKTEIDPALFGEMLHKIMERIYLRYRLSSVDRYTISSLRSDTKTIERIIREIINSSYLKGRPEEMAGNDQIIANILASYVKQILQYDASVAPLTIVDLEKEIKTLLDIEYQGRTAGLETGGIIDRIDAAGGIYRIVDYKSGATAMEITSVESLFDEANKNRNEAWFQILMYCEIYSGENKSASIRPSLYALRNLSDTGFSDYLVLKPDRNTKIVVDNYEEIRQEFFPGLTAVLTDIFSSNVPFLMTEHRNKCDYCPYRQLCQR
jgi:CRISPR/Cas system-associated exonuclease Cas4 (RecB family)